VAFPHQFGGLELQLRDELIFRLGHTMRAVLDASKVMPAELPARQQVLALLRHAYTMLDLRAGWQSEGFADSAAAALATLERGMAELAEQAAATPQIVASGHGHLDVAWLWPLWRTRQKVAHTVAIALDLMERYPEYHFSMSQPQVFAYLKEDDPQLYARLKAQVAAGRFEPVGAMWVEPDCNLPSGESLIRQLAHGVRFFMQEFPQRYGDAMAAPHVVWLPDVFGYNAALPQILRGCGISCFMTTKLSWNQTNRFPADTFRWRGIDGSEVLAHFLTTAGGPVRHPHDPQYFSYGGPVGAAEVAGAWRHYRQQQLNQELLLLYGHADGGGGPDEAMLESLRALHQIPGMPQLRPGRADDFFARLYERVWNDPRLPTWVGELYFEYHRGTYTSQAAIKRANRAAELQYRAAEWLNAWATSEGAPNQQAQLDAGWRTILLNQFHDILPGSSIAAVYEEAHADYAEVKHLGDQVIDAAVQAIVGAQSAELRTENREPRTISAEQNNLRSVVFNSLAWERRELMQLPPTLVDALGAAEHQLIEEPGVAPALLVAVTAPPFGYAPLVVQRSDPGALSVEREQLANDEIEIGLDAQGEIQSLYDRRHKRELVLSGSSLNQLVLYEDRPLEWDAWDIDHFYLDKAYPVREIVDWSVMEAGPLRATIAITRRAGQSTITQRISLRRNSRIIDIHSEVDWQERQMLLRALFPLALNTTQATCEIQFGALERPTHRNTSWDQARFEVCAQRWVDVGEGDYGVALLNNGIYGHSLRDSTLGLSLLKSAIFPDQEADRGVHRFTYSLYPHAGDWRAAQVVRRAYELNAPLWASTLPITHTSAPQLPSSRSFVKTASEHVVVETIKVADDGDGLIVRLYEAHNQRGLVTLSFERPVQSVEETDLLERSREPLVATGNSISFAVRPFEIKTLRVRLA
jgi:alpha-mannosidase